VPLQDVLGLGSESRFNTPGKLGGNWRWRFQADQLTPATAQHLNKFVVLYDREGIA
jgi:4-alpha-glucanotransferase